MKPVKIFLHHLESVFLVAFKTFIKLFYLTSKSNGVLQVVYILAII